jgi:uncharacterized protein
MYINRNQAVSANFVTAYTQSEITIGTQVRRASFIMDNEKTILNWPVSDAAKLTIENLEAAISRGPEIILLGTGSRIIFPANDVRMAVLSKGIGFEIMDTRAACRTFNILAGESRHVVAALILESQ